MKEWVVRVDRDAAAYTAVPSTLRAMSQTKSLAQQTTAFMRQLNAPNHSNMKNFERKHENTASAKQLRVIDGL